MSFKRKEYKDLVKNLEEVIGEDVHLPQAIRAEKKRNLARGKPGAITRNGKPVQNMQHDPEFWKNADKVVHLTKEQCQKILDNPDAPASLKKGLIYNIDKFSEAVSDHAIPINVSQLLDYAIDGKKFDFKKVRGEDAD